MRATCLCVYIQRSRAAAAACRSDRLSQKHHAGMQQPARLESNLNSSLQWGGTVAVYQHKQLLHVLHFTVLPAVVWVLVLQEGQAVDAD